MEDTIRGHPGYGGYSRNGSVGTTNVDKSVILAYVSTGPNEGSKVQTRALSEIWWWWWSIIDFLVFIWIVNCFIIETYFLLDDS